MQQCWAAELRLLGPNTSFLPLTGVPKVLAYFSKRIHLRPASSWLLLRLQDLNSCKELIQQFTYEVNGSNSYFRAIFVYVITVLERLNILISSLQNVDATHKQTPKTQTHWQKLQQMPKR